MDTRATRAEQPPPPADGGHGTLSPGGAPAVGSSAWLERVAWPGAACSELGLGVAERDLASEGHAQIPSFLSATERESYARLRLDKRRRDWLLGRLTAKRLVQRVAGAAGLGDVPLDAISIEPASDGAPTIVVLEPRLRALATASLSISHTHGVAVCALSRDSTVGVDIEQVETRSDLFVADFFTEEEQQQVAMAHDRERAVVATAIWSAKEAVLKACRLGLTIDTRSLSCRLDGDSPHGWGPFSCRWDRSRPLPDAVLGLPRELAGQWRQVEDFVVCLVALARSASTPSAPPVG
jgi:4'-phosphopantetheinyl transferase